MESKELTNVPNLFAWNSEAMIDVLEHMSAEAKSRSREETPKSKKKERPGKGGGVWTYAKIDYFEDLLNKDFPGWSYEVKEWKVTGPPKYEEVVVSVRLIIIDNGIRRNIDDSGGAEVKYLTEKDPNGGKHKTDIPLSIANDVKAGITDGLKRCCYRLGYARDLRVDPADMDISEEEYGIIMNAIEKFPEDVKTNIKDIVYKQINKGNFKRFMVKSILPQVKKIDPDKYAILAQSYGVFK